MVVLSPVADFGFFSRQAGCPCTQSELTELPGVKNIEQSPSVELAAECPARPALAQPLHRRAHAQRLAVAVFCGLRGHPAAVLA